MAQGFSFLEMGRPGDWDEDGHVRPGSALICYGDKVFMYYCSGCARDYEPRPDLPQGGFTGIGLATWRRDGFVSLRAAGQAGTLITKAFVPDRQFLHLNIDAAQGEARIEQCRATGDAGRELNVAEVRGVNSTDLSIQWQKKGAVLKPGEHTYLRITLRNAELYSFWCEGQQEETAKG